MTTDEEKHHLALIASRPPCGKAGQPVQVMTNSFPVRAPVSTIHIYHVDFEPALPEDAVDQRRSTINQLSIRDRLDEEYGVRFFENTRLWALREVPGDIPFTNKESTMTVSIRYLKSINLSEMAPQDWVQYEQIVHIMLNKVIRLSQLTRIGRNFFEKGENLFGSQGKLDIKGERGDPNIRLWRGYSVTIEQAIGGLQLHVDVVHRVLHQQSVANFIETVHTEQLKNPNRGRDQNVANARRIVEEALKDSAVLTGYNKRVYRVHSIDWDIGINDTFEKDGKQVSYKDYYQDSYGESCSQRFKGMLVHIPKQRKVKKGPDRIVLAPELCYLTGLSKKLKKNYTFMRKMADTTRISPPDRHRMAEALVARLQRTVETQNSMEGDEKNSSRSRTSSNGSGSRGSGSGRATPPAGGAVNNLNLPLLMDSNAIKLTGRQLPPFKITVRSDNGRLNQVDPYRQLSRSAGDASYVDKSLTPIKKWVIFYEDERLARTLLEQISMIAKKARIWGRYLHDNPEKVQIQRGQAAQHVRWEQTMKEVIDGFEPDMVVCVLPDDRRGGNPTAVYNMIKTLCCTQKPVLSQCITTRSLNNQKRLRSIMQNVVKQMMTKAGNTPWRVDWQLPDGKLDLKKPTMICGLDVNHDVQRNVSTVGMCASYSHDYTKYYTFVMSQKVGREVMIDGANLMLASLKKFKSRYKILPSQIIVYRDGVSTSQLTTIVLEEVRAFKSAFSGITIKGKPYRPKLSVIVVQKRVTARFLTTNLRSLNPGTLIDTEVVSKKFWDFYIVPCEAPFKGTAIPTRFIVAYDDIRFTQDDIAALTNQLCLLYYNWAGPVRVPAPVQYAHKIAHMFGSAIDQRTPHETLNGRPFYL